MEIIGVIPARLESQRMTQKLLRTVRGKALIQWTWERARQARMLDDLIIACDSRQLLEAAEGFGGRAVLTSSQHLSGTDRIAEAVRDIEVRIVINIQADEPLIHPSVIDSLATCMASDRALTMATVKKRIDDEEEVLNPNVVKVVTNKDNFALYFSRQPLPFCRDAHTPGIYYKHIGIYAYTKDFLFTFKNLPSSYLERAEKLEQLRALEAGHRIKVVETKFDSWGVDTEEDLKKIDAILSQKGGA